MDAESLRAVAAELRQPGPPRAGTADALALALGWRRDWPERRADDRAWLDPRGQRHESLPSWFDKADDALSLLPPGWTPIGAVWTDDAVLATVRAPDWSRMSGRHATLARALCIASLEALAAARREASGAAAPVA